MIYEQSTACRVVNVAVTYNDRQGPQQVVWVNFAAPLNTLKSSDYLPLGFGGAVFVVVGRIAN